MKKLFTLVCAGLFIAVQGLNAQPYLLPNGGYENWTSGANSRPVGWSTVESAAGSLAFLLGGKQFTTKETTPANVTEGAASAKLKSDSVTVTGQGSFLIPGTLILGTATLNTANLGGGGLPIDVSGYPFTYRPDSLRFTYKYVPTGSDTGSVIAAITAYSGGSTKRVASADLRFTGTGNSFITATIPFDYDSTNGNLTPDTLNSFILSSGTAGRVGSTLWIDDVKLVYNNQPNGISEVSISAYAVKVFPNPASAVLNFVANTSLDNAVATVYAIDGRKVLEQTVVSDKITTDALTTGKYLFNITRDGKIVGQGNFNISK
jgi:hypothetical protein